MKFVYIFFSAILFSAVLAGQNNTSALISLKDGTSIDAKHFGQKGCGNNQFIESYIIVRGKYSGIVTEIKDYSSIRSMKLAGFSKPPVASVGNEKGTIVVTKKSGVSVELEEAELVMSCYSAGDRYNMVKVQIINPLTDEVVEKAIEVKDIDQILFK
ncbi:MAG: hypothetical protein JXJ22_05905 [Bacteroidales bacterium]|nr:hypothetical protein [Bacteroidales bacterium]